MRYITCLLVFCCLLLPCSSALADIVINEVMASNGVYTDGHAYDWIELYNNSKSSVDLSGWHLSDSKKDLTKWSFPEGAKLKGGEYLTIYCTGSNNASKGKNSIFYADFKISASGETLYLSDANGELLQKLKLPAQYGNISYGLDSNGQYGFFEQATRAKANDKKSYKRQLDAPQIVTAGGFYQGKILVEVTADANAVIRYTTDGETPTAKSSVFPAKGLTISKTTVLRIRCFADDAVSSPTVSASYFINDDPQTPIVSLITDDKYLFNSKTGALVKGSNKYPNYEMEWEYPVNIEYFNIDGDCEINQMGTFTCSGHSARINAQKSIAIYARKAWGNDSFEFNPFPTRDYESYHSLLLRAANSDAYATRLRDVIASSLAENQGILYQDAQMIQVYINGKYWGHYNLREKINKYFIAQYEGVTEEEDIDNIDILARTGRDEFLQNGDNTDWLELCDFCKTHDLNDPDNLQYVLDRLDVDNMFTHAAFQILLGNVDITNVRVYRVPGGKWRYLLFDVEACWRNLDTTPIEYYIKPVTAKINGFRHEPLNALLAVPEMKERFLNRIAQLMVESFQWPHVESVFDQWTSELETILPRHIERWNNLKYKDWIANINAIKYYARLRPLKVPSMLKSAMKLTDSEIETYFGEALAVLEGTNR